MGDILFKTPDWIFSYRVAGICVRDGKVLLQKEPHDPTMAFPGGHVVFGQTHAQTLIREFREEMGAQIAVGDLKWVAEIFFPWGNTPCHQICIYYLVDITDDTTPRDGIFLGKEQLENREFHLEFHWVPLEEAAQAQIYPIQCRQLLGKLDGGVEHFVYQE